MRSYEKSNKQQSEGNAGYNKTYLGHSIMKYTELFAFIFNEKEER